jgi:hypothetical protein
LIGGGDAAILRQPMSDPEHNPFAASSAVIDDSHNPPEPGAGKTGDRGVHALTWVAFAMGALGIGFIALPVALWPLPLVWFPAALLLSIVGIARSARKPVAAMAVVMIVVAAFGCWRAMSGRWVRAQDAHELGELQDKLEELERGSGHEALRAFDDEDTDRSDASQPGRSSGTVFARVDGTASPMVTVRGFV